MATQRDLALAYSPGRRRRLPRHQGRRRAARDYTARANLVAVISNGTAVLGLGNIGPLACKPVMEGKAVLFKKFAGIDVFDIEVEASDPRPLHRGGGRAGADLRRHQPRGHQGPRVLRDRAHAARAHAHPGVPRRPARHRHHRRRRRAQRPAAAGQDAGGGAGRHLGRRRGGARLRGPAGVHGAARGQRHADGHQGRGVPRPRRGHAAQHGALRPRDGRAHAGAGAGRRRRVPGPLGPRRAEARVAASLRGEAADPGAGQPRPGDLARGGARGASGRDRGHRAQRLPQPGQQRPVLPVHLPRRAGRGRARDQRGDEDRLRGGDRGAGPCRGERGGGGGLWRPRAGVRPRVHHPQAVRPAPDPADRAGGGARRHGERRGRAPDRRHGRLPARAGAVRVPLRPAHAPGVRGGAPRPQPHRLRRGRGRAGAARGADGGGRRHRPPDPDRPPRGDRAAGARDGAAARPRRRGAGGGAGRGRARPRCPSATARWSGGAAPRRTARSGTCRRGPPCWPR